MVRYLNNEGEIGAGRPSSLFTDGRERSPHHDLVLPLVDAATQRSSVNHAHFRRDEFGVSAVVYDQSQTQEPRLVADEIHDEDPPTCVGLERVTLFLVVVWEDDPLSMFVYYGVKGVRPHFILPVAEIDQVYAFLTIPLVPVRLNLMFHYVKNHLLLLLHIQEFSLVHCCFIIYTLSLFFFVDRNAISSSVWKFPGWLVVV